MIRHLEQDSRNLMGVEVIEVVDEEKAKEVAEVKV